MSFVTPLASAVAPTKKTKSRGAPQAYNFGGLFALPFDLVPTVGAGEANTSILATLYLPQHMKISKVAVGLTAIDSIAGTDSFNIVMGFGAYTQGDLPPVDDQPKYGYSTQFAADGDCMFSSDVTFTVANFPGIIAVDPQNNQNIISPPITTANGGSTVLVPTVYDNAFYQGTPLTLRATTTASTGLLTNLKVVLLGEAIDILPASSNAVPNINW